jgi:hypothetical protein
MKNNPLGSGGSKIKNSDFNPFLIQLDQRGGSKTPGTLRRREFLGVFLIHSSLAQLYAF